MVSALGSYHDFPKDAAATRAQMDMAANAAKLELPEGWDEVELVEALSVVRAVLDEIEQQAIHVKKLLADVPPRGVEAFGEAVLARIKFFRLLPADEAEYDIFPTRADRFSST